MNKFLPFVCISLIIWGFLASTINESCSIFISMGGVIGQIRRPFSTYIMLVLWRNLIIFTHTIGIFFIVAVIFKIYPTESYLLIPLGLFLLIANLGWMAIMFATISARFHDIPPFVQNMMTVLVWLTPVYYNKSQVSERFQAALNLNPLTAILEVARGPFLNEIPSAGSWIIAASTALIGWILSLVLFAHLRGRISLWV